MLKSLVLLKNIEVLRTLFLLIDCKPGQVLTVTINELLVTGAHFVTLLQPGFLSLATLNQRHCNEKYSKFHFFYFSRFLDKLDVSKNWQTKKVQRTYDSVSVV